MNQIKSNIKGLVGSTSCGVRLENLEKDYRDITGETLDYRAFNHRDLRSFITSMSDVVRLNRVNNVWYVCLAETDSDPQCLKQIYTFIKNTESKKSKYKQNMSNRPLGKAINFDNLHISVSNDLHSQRYNDQNDNDRNNYSSRDVSIAKGFGHFKISPVSYQTNQKSANQMNQFNIKASNPLRNVKNEYRNERNPSQTNNSYCHIKQITPTNSSRSSLENYAPNLFDSRIKLVKPNMLENIPMKYNIDQFDEIRMRPPNIGPQIDVLYKQVKILGVLCGFAVVTVLDCIQESQFITCKSYERGTRGDIYLWQPPIPNFDRRSGSVDISTVLPVILLEHSSRKSMKVRVEGMNVILEVEIKDLYEIPTHSSLLEKLHEVNDARQVSLVRLACVPSFLQTWDQNILTDIYFSQLSINNGEFIFEQCDNRGHFLNIKLLLYFFKHQGARLQDNHQELGEHLVRELDNCKKALMQTFENMIACTDFRQSKEISVLSLINNNLDCENKMLIGCSSFFGSPNRVTRPYPTANGQLNLQRIIYLRSNDTFHYFDNNLVLADVTRKKPIFGLYILNEHFVKSRLSHVTQFRFQVAMLLHFPNIFPI